ncbi:MAG: RES family NAD+ phosphorylase [Albidovulum sp.]
MDYLKNPIFNKRRILFLSNLDIEEIKQRIANFRERARKGMPETELVNELTAIFGDQFQFGTEQRNYTTGTQFFRARPIPNDDTKIPLKTISKVGDAWEPPRAFVKIQGRLNAAGQSILYCCANDPDLAIDEARGRNNNHVAVIVYRSTRPIQVAVLGDYSNSNLAKDELSQVFYSFLDDEFSKFVSEGDEGIYTITRSVADTYFTYPEQDAWCYRSVQSPSKFNVAFLPGRQSSCIELTGVMICDLKASTLGNLSVKFVVDFDKITGFARYHQIGSAEQKRVFPEIG